MRFNLDYALKVQELDAELHQAPKQEDETAEEHQDRVAASRGMNWFRVVIQDREFKQFVMDSPYFKIEDDQARWKSFAEAMAGIESAIRVKEAVVEPEKSLIVEGSEQDLKRLLKRN